MYKKLKSLKLKSKNNGEKLSQLIHVPKPIGCESPSSWFSRVALSQGVTRKELFQFLNLPANIDFDMFFSQQTSLAILEACQIDRKHFAFAQHMLLSLKSIDEKGDIFLLQHKKTASYRYCPVCLWEQREKHLLLHWRFKAWRHCEMHGCVLDDSCRSCGASVQLPADMLFAGPKKRGVAYLDRCMVCNWQLSSHWRQAENSLKDSRMSFGERLMLKNGRAVLAAIYYGKLHYLSMDEPEYGLGELLKLERNGLLPHQHFLLDPSEIERRDLIQQTLILTAPKNGD